MNKSELTDQVRKLMIGLKTKEALELLFEYVKGEDKTLETTIIMQQGAYNRMRQDHLIGILSRANYDLAMARVNYAIEQILEQVPEKAQVSAPPNDDKIQVLFLTASPKNASQLQLGTEIRKVKDGFRSATQRDKFEFISEPAVRITTITSAMMRLKPEIVHFSGHGTGEKGLVIEGDDGKVVLFPTDGLKRLFSLFKKDVQCVVLNACYSQEQAIAISTDGIYAVGMNDAIADKAAIDFAVGFYQAIGEGYDYEFAFEMGMITIAVNVSEADKPELWYNGKKIK